MFKLNFALSAITATAVILTCHIIATPVDAGIFLHNHGEEAGTLQGQARLFDGKENDVMICEHYANVDWSTVRGVALPLQYWKNDENTCGRCVQVTNEENGLTTDAVALAKCDSDCGNQQGTHGIAMTGAALKEVSPTREITDKPFEVHFGIVSIDRCMQM